MKTWLFLSLIILLGILQVTVLNFIKVFDVMPDLLLIAVLLASLYFRPKQALLLSVASGVLKDVFGVYSFGINTALFPLWHYLVKRASQKISIENELFLATGAFAVTFINNVATRIILLSFDNFVPWSVFLRIAFIGSVYTALVFPLLYRAAKPILFIKEPEKEELIDEEV